MKPARVKTEPIIVGCEGHLVQSRDKEGIAVDRQPERGEVEAGRTRAPKPGGMCRALYRVADQAPSARVSETR